MTVTEQWVEEVKKFSSQYDANRWSADQLKGGPNVYPKYGDIEGAWATGVCDANQFAEVKFKKKVYVTGIEIYETYHAGGVKRVAALNDNKQWVTLWETEKVKDIEESRIFKVPLKETDFKTKDIRIDIDCSLAGSWVEIDAIKLVGKEDTDEEKMAALGTNVATSSFQFGWMGHQWVKSVKKFSSQYDSDLWSANQLKGEPKVYPKYGDISGTWAVGDIDANQFVEVEFDKSVYVTGIEIYETFNAGGTKRVAALNDNKQWVTLWETGMVTDIEQSRIFSPPLEATSFKTKDIRLEIDCTVAGTWVEIDAIKLIGTTDKEKSGKPDPLMNVPSQALYNEPGTEQWVHKVKKFSSEYDSYMWSADHLRGKPYVYPMYGDLEGAWATGDIDANQFAEVAFKKAVYVTGIEIYETFHAGGTKRVAARNKKKQWVTLWETDKITDIGQSRIFSPPLKQTTFKTKHIRIEIDCTVAETWVEIDAIKLIGKQGGDDSSDSSDSDSDSDRKKKKKQQKNTSKSCTVL